MKTDKGFTLIEMVIALGVIALIGTLLIQSVATTSANTKTADLIVFLDQTTKQAREKFEAYPNEVLNNHMSLSDSEFYPYNDMAYQMVSANELHYRASFTKNLKRTTMGSSDEIYLMDINFTGIDKSTPAGFSFRVKSFQMKTTVYEKIGGVMNEEPIYTKEFTFDNVMIQEFPTIQETRKVIFHGNGGCIVASLDAPTCISTSVEKEYYKGDSIYGTTLDGSRTPFGYQEHATFIGWSLSNSDRNLITNSFRVEEDTTVYAQYLAENQYRLEFSINGSERFNVDGITGEDAIKPYYVENGFSHSPVLVKDMDNVERFFTNNAVRKNGYQFLYWEDKDGNEVTLESIIDEPHMILYPHFEQLEDGDQEVLSANLVLDLTNVSAGNNMYDNSNRLFSVYPFTKMEYNLEYDAATDAFTITQNEIFSGDYGSWTGMRDGDVMSSKTFRMGSDAEFYFSSGGEKYHTLTEYINAIKDHADHSFSIGDIRLKVKMPTFDLGSYYATDSLHDELKSANSITLSETQATTLLQEDHDAQFTFIKKNNQILPIANDDSILALNNKIADLTGNKGSFTNVGSVRFESTGNVSYDTYQIMTTIPGEKYDITDDHIVEIAYKLIIPGSTIYGRASNFVVGNIETFVQYNEIYIKVDIKFANGNWATSNGGPIVYSTGIPFVRDQGKNGPDGKPLKQYQRITDIGIGSDIYTSTDGISLGNTEVKTRMDYTVNGKPSWYPPEAFEGIYDGKYSEGQINNFNRNYRLGNGIAWTGRLASDTPGLSGMCASVGMSWWGPRLINPGCVAIPGNTFHYPEYYAKTIHWVGTGEPVIANKTVNTFKKDSDQSYLPPFITNVQYQP